MLYFSFRIPAFKQILAATAVLLACAPVSAQERPALDVPYIKTPVAVVERMLEMARVNESDALIDLGSGDGRIPIAAAKQYGTRGLGVDLDPERTREARKAAQAAGVSEQVTFRTEDLFDTDLSSATVISMYLFPEINLRLRPELLRLKPGTRIISHAFHMDDWTPERHDVVEGRDIFLWTVPARVEGLWNVSAAGYQRFVLRLWQQFDRLQGVAITQDERSIPLSDITIHGPDISFSMNTTEGLYTFTGKVDGHVMTGTSTGAGQWSASKM